MYDACETLWNNIVEEKMYITGGIGGTHLGEAFSFPFDLPNDTWTKCEAKMNVPEHNGQIIIY